MTGAGDGCELKAGRGKSACRGDWRRTQPGRVGDSGVLHRGAGGLLGAGGRGAASGAQGGGARIGSWGAATATRSKITEPGASTGARRTTKTAGPCTKELGLWTPYSREGGFSRAVEKVGSCGVD